MMIVPSRERTSSTVVSSASSGRKRKRGTLFGHFTRPKRTLPGSSACTPSSSTTKLMLVFEIIGKGWPASTACGVRIGKIWRSK